MNLRYLVPTLGLLAVASTASAADGFHVGGFVDSILNLTRDFAAENDPATSQNDKDADLFFTTTAEIRLTGKIGQDVSVRVEVEFQNQDAGNIDDEVDVGQAFANYAFNKEWSWTMGKFTSYLGWVAHDSDGLYRVNGGIIPALYGSDLLGSALNWKVNDAWAASFFVVNGFGFDGLNQGLNGVKNAADDRADHAVGLGIDVVWDASKQFGKVNFEIAYDIQGSGNGGGAAGNAGDVLQIGVNTTIQCPQYKDLTIGAEVIYQAISDSEEASNGSNNVGFLLMANHVLPKGWTPFPASATLMYQKVGTDLDDDVGDHAWNNEIALAILTNPTGDSHFGVNLEFFVQTSDGGTAGGNPADPNDNDNWGVAFEVLAVLE